MKKNVASLLILLLCMGILLCCAGCNSQQKIDDAVAPVSEQVTAIDGSVSDLQAANEALSAYILALETTVSELEDQLSDMEGQLSDLKTELGKADADNKSALETRISDLESALEVVKNDLADAKREIQTAYAAAIAQAIEDWNGNLDTVSDALKASDKALKTAIEKLEDELDAVKEQVDSNADAIADLQEQVKQNIADVSALEKELADTQAALEALTNRFNCLVGIHVVVEGSATYTSAYDSGNDLVSYTAQYTCEHCGQTITEEAEIAYKDGTYTASFTNEGLTTQNVYAYEAVDGAYTVYSAKGLTEAVEAIGAGEGKIVLGTNITLTEGTETVSEYDATYTVPGLEISQGNITIDLNGYTLSGGSKYATITLGNGAVSVEEAEYGYYGSSVYAGYEISSCAEGTSLTILDSSEAQTGTITGGECAIKSYGADLTVEGGKISIETEEYFAKAIHMEGGDLTVNGGSIIAKAEGYAVAIECMDAGAVTITGGSFYAEATGSENLIANTLSVSNIGSDSATVTITGGQFEMKKNGTAKVINHAVYLGNVDAEISGGTFKVSTTAAEKVYNILINPGTLTISGGTFESGLYICNTTAQITGGTFTATCDNFYVGNSSDETSGLSITGGTFGEDPSEYVAEGYGVATNSDSTYTVYPPYVKNEDGSYTVYTVAGLTELVDNGASEIILGTDMVLTNTLNVTADLVLDLNGHTLSASLAKVITYDSDCKNLTVTDRSENGGGAVRNSYTGTGLSSSVIASIADDQQTSVTVEKVTISNSTSGVTRTWAIYIQTAKSGTSLKISNATIRASGTGAVYGVADIPGEDGFRRQSVIIENSTITASSSSTSSSDLVVAVNVHNEGSVGELRISGNTLKATASGASCTALRLGFDEYEDGLCICDGTYVGGLKITGFDLTITGGTFSEDPSEYVAEGYGVATNSDSTYTVYPPYVKNEDGSYTVYSAKGLTTAVEAIGAGEGKIVLGMDIAGEETTENLTGTLTWNEGIRDVTQSYDIDAAVPVLRIYQGNITIDLNGHILSGGSNCGTITLGERTVEYNEGVGRVMATWASCAEGTSLTILDSSEAKTGKIQGARYGIYNAGATVVIESGTVCAENSDTTVWGIYAASGTVTVTGGTVSTTTNASGGYDAIGIYSDNSTVTISGGTVTVEATGGASAYCVFGYSNVTVTGGTITASSAETARAFDLTGGTLSVSGEAVITAQNGSGENGAVNVSNMNSVTISGGTLTGDVWAIRAQVTISGGSVKGQLSSLFSDSTITVTGGTHDCTYQTYYNGVISITGGTFSADPSDYVAEGYVVKANDDDTYTVVSPTYVSTSEELQDAIANVGSNDVVVIVLTADIEVVEAEDEINMLMPGLWIKQGDITIDLNGYTLSGGSTYATIVVAGLATDVQYNYYSEFANCADGTSLTITDSSEAQTGKITGKQAIDQYGGTVNIAGGTLTYSATWSRVIRTLNGTLNITGGTICAGAGGDYNYAIVSENATVNISGGSISAFTSSDTAIWVYSGTASISGGSVTGVIGKNTAGKISISGGTFSEDPSGYVADGYGASQNEDDTWTVTSNSVSNGGSSISGGSIIPGDNSIGYGDDNS